VTTFVPVDQDVRERIRSRVGENFCIEAGAGTGKTSVLVSRVVEIVRAGHATVDELAVITFTEAAAAELAARVRQELEAAIAGAGEDERHRIRTALDGLHRARIETIHAFAANMLRERPVEAGLDPAFEVMDELAERVAFDDAYQRWLTELLAEARPEVWLAIRRGFELDRIRQLVGEIDRYRSLLPLAPERARSPDLAGFLAVVDAAASELAELLDHGAGDERAVPEMQKVIALAARLREAHDDPVELERTILFRAPAIKAGAGAQRHWSSAADCRRSKALRGEVCEALARVRDELRTEAIVGVLPLAERFVADYEATRKREGRADFDDLLEWTRDLLAESAEARAFFRRRFRAILVDEFQDTDPIQADIVLCLASDDDPGEDWLALRPRPGSLTIVGDPKQSIYRFRRADIAVYDALRHGPLGGSGAELVQNFRSVAGILGWVNGVFDRVFVPQEGVQPANTTLHPGPAALPDESLSICVVRGEPMERAGEIRREEARLLAGVLRRAVEDRWQVRDRATGEVRDATYGDVAILVPRRTELDVYLEAFRRAGIPVRAESGRSFFQRQEVRDFATLLRAVDDPLDQVALLAALRSAALGCSDEEIYLHVAAGGRLDYRAPAGESPAAVADALALLRDLNDLRSRVSLAQLVRAVLERTRLVEIALAGWDGQQSAANLVKLADQARAFSASGGGGLRAFARWLAEQRGSSDMAEASVAEESDDVVRLMTVHASKGLEFPIVALANLGTRGSGGVEAVPDRRARRLHLAIGRADARFETPGFDAAWADEELRVAAEEKRLLYVAVTRARDHLIVPVAAAAEKAGPMLRDLLPSLPPGDGAGADGCHVVDGSSLGAIPDDEPPLPEDASEREVEAALAERAAWERARAAIVRRAREELEVFPATRDEGDLPVAAALLGADDAPLIAGEGPPLAKGEALHRVLELLDLASPTDLEGTVRSVCRVAGIEDHAGEVQRMAEACLASGALARALRAPARWREVPYTRRVEGGYATGRIDLVFEEDGALVVVDWKSDSIAPSQAEAAAEAHRPQAEAYAAALAAATGRTVREVVFVFPRARAEAAIRPQPADARPSSGAA